jgi:hypothetical protein
MNGAFNDSVTCRMVRVTNKRTLRRLIGFITTSVTHALLITITSKQYSSIVDLHFTIQFFIFTNNLPRLPATKNCRELSGAPPVSHYITSAPTAQKTSHAFLIVACRPIAAEMRSNAEMCLLLRCVATFATRTL